jgi:hypothetical protein
MKIKSFRIIFLFSLIFLFVLPGNAIAVTKTSGDLRLTVDEPMFPSNIIWYPGLSKEKVMTVENLGDETKKVYFRAENTSQTGDISQVLSFSANKEGTDLYGDAGSKTLQNFWDEGDVELFNLEGKSSAEVDVKLSMFSSAGNEYQAKKAQFDLVIGFVETTETVTVTAAGNGGGTAAGGNAAVCSDAKPNTPGNFSVNIGSSAGEAVLSWTAPAVPPPYTYFLIAYSDNVNELKWGNPDIGTGTSYTVSGLAAGTYYFWVRAGNGCMPGDFIGPESVTLGVGASGAVPGVPAPGFERGVLGESTPSAKIATSPTIESVNGEVKGTRENANNKTKMLSLVFWLLAIPSAIISAYFIRGRKEEKNK